MPAKKKAPLFFAARKKKAGTGLDFSPKKNQSRLGAPPGQPGRIFFSRLGRAGTGLVFLFRGPGRDWIFFFVERLAWGRDWIFFFETGLDFSLLEQSAEPRSKDSQRKSRPTGKPSSNEKSSPVSEACRGGLVGFFFRGPRKKIQSRLGGPPGRPGRIFFSRPGRAGTGLAFLLFISQMRKIQIRIFRGARKIQSRRLFISPRKKKSSPVEPKNPVPSGALLPATLEALRIP